MTAYEINGKEYEVDYDLDNRIIKADIDGDDVEYRYDAFGRRVIRKEGSTKTALIWWANSECAEYKHSSGQAAIQNDLFAHPSRLNAVIARAVDGSKSKLQWYHKNYLDHVYAVSDDDGDILEHYRYTAFGEVTIYNATGVQQTTTQINNQILWNTRRRDTVSGYYMYKFRHYSPELGRWPSRDPIEEKGGGNLYAFVGNDGINRIDELGLACIIVNGQLTCTNPTPPPTPGSLPGPGQTPGRPQTPGPFGDVTPDDYGTEVPNDELPDDDKFQDGSEKCCSCKFASEVMTGRSNKGRPSGPAGFGGDCKVGAIRVFKYEGVCDPKQEATIEDCDHKTCTVYAKWVCKASPGSARWSPERGLTYDGKTRWHAEGGFRHSKCQ